MKHSSNLEFDSVINYLEENVDNSGTYKGSARMLAKKLGLKFEELEKILRFADECWMLSWDCYGIRMRG